MSKRHSDSQRPTAEPNRNIVRMTQFCSTGAMPSLDGLFSSRRKKSIAYYYSYFKTTSKCYNRREGMLWNWVEPKSGSWSARPASQAAALHAPACRRSVLASHPAKCWLWPSRTSTSVHSQCADPCPVCESRISHFRKTTSRNGSDTRAQPSLSKKENVEKIPSHWRSTIISISCLSKHALAVWVEGGLGLLLCADLCNQWSSGVLASNKWPTDDKNGTQPTWRMPWQFLSGPGGEVASSGLSLTITCRRSPHPAASPDSRWFPGRTMPPHTSTPVSPFATNEAQEGRLNV